MAYHMTPLVDLGTSVHPQVRVLLKAEWMLPSGSTKWRTARALLTAALAREPDLEGVVAATSGNLGVALAWHCERLGLRCVVACSEAVPAGKRARMEQLGAEVRTVTAEAPGRMHGRDLYRAGRLADRIGREQGLTVLRQWTDLAAVAVHRDVTAREVSAQAPVPVDIVVAAVGSGGTLAGLVQGLCDSGVSPKAVAVEPEAVKTLRTGRNNPQPHDLFGVGLGVMPPHLRDVVLWEAWGVPGDHAPMELAQGRPGPTTLACLEVIRRRAPAWSRTLGPRACVLVLGSDGIPLP